MMLPYCSAHVKQFFTDVLRHETCGSECCSKIAKLLAKTTSHGHCSGDVDDVQRRSKFAQKGYNW